MKWFCIFLFLFLPVYADATFLPSHFGSEVGLVWSGKYNPKTSSFRNISIETDISSSKLLKDKLYITSVGRLGQESGSGIGVSVFGKINSFTYIGFSSLAGEGFELDHNATVLLSVSYGEWKIEPYMLTPLNGGFIPEVGMRIYVKKHISFLVSAFKDSPKDKLLGIRFGVKVPLHDFGILETLMDYASSPEKIKEEVEKEVK